MLNMAANRMKRFSAEHICFVIQGRNKSYYYYGSQEECEAHKVEQKSYGKKAQCFRNLECKTKTS